MADMPPEELQYQLDNIDESRAPQMIAADISCTVIILVSLFARIVSRYVTGVSLKSDDYTMIVATFLIMGLFVVGFMFDFVAGFGKHQMALTDYENDLQAKLVFAYDCFYNIAYPPIKISILLFYHRIFVYRRFRQVNGVAIGFLVCYMIATTLVGIFSCIPVKASWDFTVEPIRCIDENMFYIASASVNVFTDVLILVLPLPIVWKLKISKAQKIAVSFIFALGGATCVVSALRIVLYLRLNPYDLSYSFVDPSIATNVEICLAVVCANLPALRPLGRWAVTNTRFGSYFGSFVQRYGKSYGRSSRSQSKSGSGSRSRNEKIPKQKISETELVEVGSATDHETGSRKASRHDTGYEFKQDSQVALNTTTKTDAWSEAERGIPPSAGITIQRDVHQDTHPKSPRPYEAF